MNKSDSEILEDEITLKEIILKVQDYFWEIAKKWWLIALVCVFTTGFFLYKHFTHVPTYNAELRFVVEGQGGVGGGLGGLLGTFGIKKGGSVNQYKIIEVGKSNKLFEDIIFTAFRNDTTIADQIITEYGLLEKWTKENENYKDFHFVNDQMNRPIEKLTFKRLKSLTWGSPENDTKALTYLTLDEERGIYSLSTSTTNEDLSIVMTNRLYKGIKQFFEDEVFENQKRSAEILSAKADSVNNLMTQKIYQLARFEDRNQRLLYKENASKKVVLTQEIQALSMAYSELIKNYELTDVNLKDLQPLFMEIDRPFSPINPSESSLLKNLLLGLFIGVVLGMLLILAHLIFRDIME